MDIDPNTLISNRALYPDHHFRAWDFGFTLPPADTLFLNVASLQAPATWIGDILDFLRTCYLKIIICDRCSASDRLDGAVKALQATDHFYRDHLQDGGYHRSARRDLRVLQGAEDQPDGSGYRILLIVKN